MSVFDQNRPRPSQADVPRLLADIQENARVWGEQFEQWVRSALYYAEEVSRLGISSHASLRALFWIRAYAALTDLRDVFEQKAEFLAELNQYPGGPAGPAWAALTRSVLDSIEAVRRELSEDELVYFWYRRQVEVHPFQDAVRLRVTKTGAVSDRRRVDLILSRECTVEELNGAIRRVLVRYGNEDAIAVDFARRLLGPLRVMVESCERYLAGP